MSFSDVIWSVVGLGVVGVAGYLVYQHYSSDQQQQQQQPDTPVKTPDTVWSPTQWFIPSSAPDLLTQWQENAAAANVGGITDNPLSDPLGFASQWLSSVTTATGLAW